MLHLDLLLVNGNEIDIVRGQGEKLGQSDELNDLTIVHLKSKFKGRDQVKVLPSIEKAKLGKARLRRLRQLSRSPQHTQPEAEAYTQLPLGDYLDISFAG
jgi:hypothetical protein